MRPLRIGIIGTGDMAHSHADVLGKINNVNIVAACDVDEPRVNVFSRKYRIPATYTDPEAMIRHEAMDAVTIVTPDGFHAPIALLALDAGLHILCEKPLATTTEDADRMAAAAGQAGVINMVNFSYRRSSALHEARKFVDEGRIGRLIHFEAHYLQSWLVSSAWGDWRTRDAFLWRLSSGHGSGGVLGDIGVHLLDFVTFPAGKVDWLECTLRTFSKHEGNQIGPYTLDANDSATITLSLNNGALGTLHMSRWATGHLNSIGLTLYGDEGAIRIDLDDSYDRIRCCIGQDVEQAEWRTVELDPAPSVIAQFVDSIRSGHNHQPDFERGAYVQRLIQACFDSDAERKRAYPGT